MAEATGWERLNLLQGEANVYFENTFVGKSILDPGQTSDTLRFSMGRDRSIRIERTKENDYSSRRAIGSNQTQTVAWKFSVRNTRPEPVVLTLADQLPVSRNSAIAVSAEELSGGQLDKESGIVTWRLELKPGEQRELRLRYAVKCFMKYSYEEKLAAVLSVVRGQHSVSSASKHFGISYTPLSRWIARYKEFGEAGLRIRQYTYSGDFKLSAIRHMHENHLSLTETTAKFGIYNESTLSKWERIYYEEGESGLYRDNRGKMRTKPNKQELQPQEENDLRVENQRLRAEVAYLKKIEGLSRGTHRPRERERAKSHRRTKTGTYPSHAIGSYGDGA